MLLTQGFARTRTLLFAVGLLSLAGNATSAEVSTAISPTERHDPYLNDDAWINDIGALLYDDVDGDGYFSGLSLTVDADSSYGRYEVYLIIDIINEFNEVELFHTTRRFDIYDNNFSDEYRIEIDLVENYDPGLYELQIILVDAHDDQILDQVNARDFRNLRALPLESRDNQFVDSPVVDRPVVDRPVGPANDGISVNEYGGSAGFFIVLLMLLNGVYRACSFSATETAGTIKSKK